MPEKLPTDSLDDRPGLPKAGVGLVTAWVRGYGVDWILGEERAASSDIRVIADKTEEDW